MKKTLLTLSLVAVSVAAFGQGKINFNNTGRYISYSTDPNKLVAADKPLAGQHYYTASTSGASPGGILLNVGLYGSDVSAASETLITTVPLSSSLSPDDGLFYPISNLNLPAGMPGGVQAFFQVKFWDSAYASYDAALAGGSYAGASVQFTQTPGVAVPTSLSTGGGSTWTAGPMSVGIVPEPTTMALAGLGAAALLIFRRRK